MHPSQLRRKSRYPAIRSLRRMCGAQDAFIDMTELAIRLLLREANGAGLGTREYVERLRRELNVPSSLVELSAVQSNAAKFYIVQTHLVAERFFDDLLREMVLFGPLRVVTRQKDNQQLDSLSAFLHSVGPQTREEIESWPEYGLLQYYRSVRNAVMHPGERAAARVADSCTKIVADHELYLAENYRGLRAPNSLSRVTHDDFLLYTRVLKRFAGQLNLLFEPRLERIANALVNDPVHKPELLRVRSAPGKLTQVISRYVAPFSLDSHERAEVDAAVREWLDREPTKRERRRSRRRAGSSR